VGFAIQEHTDRATRVWLYSSIVCLTVVDSFGLILATELLSPNVFRGLPSLIFSRIRPLHVTRVIFPWLSMMFWGYLKTILPAMVSHPEASPARLAPSDPSQQVQASIQGLSSNPSSLCSWGSDAPQLHKPLGTIAPPHLRKV
jgi:hypothetical protein